MKPLNSDMLDLLRQCPLDRYFVAADLSWSRPGPTGNALTRLAERGFLKRSSDPTTWGRSRYALTPSGVAMRWGLPRLERGPSGPDNGKMSWAERDEVLFGIKPPLDIKAIFARATQIAQHRYPDGVSSAGVLGDIVTEAINTMHNERAASADTHPKDGDVQQAPLVSGAVPKADAQPQGGTK
jgi:hypothetical protein